MTARAFIFLLLLLPFSFGGMLSCGRYADPEPPEYFSPLSIRDLVIRPQANGVEFTWTSPDADFRGRELRSMDGYQVYRKLFEVKSDLIDPRGYEELGFVEDKHIRVLLKKRKAAIKKGVPTRKVKVDDSLKHFRYFDSSVEVGKTYLYKITPVNQGNVEGLTDVIVKIEFHGLNSTVFLMGIRGEDAVEVAPETATQMGASSGSAATVQNQ